MDTKPRQADSTLELLDTRLISESTIILDIDGTITPDSTTDVSCGILRAIQSLASRNVVYLFSNHRDNARNRSLARSLGLQYIDTPYRKPSRKIIEAIPACHRKKPIVVIGDKIAVDGLFAQRVRAQFIKVGRVLSASDRPSAKVAYFLDDLIAWFVARLGRRPRTMTGP